MSIYCVFLQLIFTICLYAVYMKYNILTVCCVMYTCIHVYYSYYTSVYSNNVHNLTIFTLNSIIYVL